MQYRAIFHGCEMTIFRRLFFYNFHIFAQNMFIVGTRQNRPIEAVLTSTHNIYFRAKIKKK